MDSKLINPLVTQGCILESASNINILLVLLLMLSVLIPLTYLMINYFIKFPKGHAILLSVVLSLGGLTFGYRLSKGQMRLAKVKNPNVCYVIGLTNKI